MLLFWAGQVLSSIRPGASRDGHKDSTAPGLVQGGQFTILRVKSTKYLSSFYKGAIPK